MGVENYGNTVETLIELGARDDVTNGFVATRLEKALSINATDTVALLLRAGVSPLTLFLELNQRADHPLHNAVTAELLSIVEAWPSLSATSRTKILKLVVAPPK